MLDVSTRVCSCESLAPALNKLSAANKDVIFHVGAVDEGESASTIFPGVGDSGDRLFGTFARTVAPAEAAALAPYSDATPKAAAAALPTPKAEEKAAPAKGRATKRKA